MLLLLQVYIGELYTKTIFCILNCFSTGEGLSVAKKIVRGSLRKHPFLLALRLLGRSPRETSPAAKSEEKRMFSQAMSGVVCCTAVFRVVTQRSTGGALRDETKNSCQCSRLCQGRRRAGS